MNKQSIKKLLNVFRLQSSFKNIFSDNVIDNSITSNLTIELLGPSGIGKTTFHAEAKKQLEYSWNHKYITNSIHELNKDPDLEDFYLLLIKSKIDNIFKRYSDLDRCIKLISFMSKRIREDKVLFCSESLEKSGWFLDDSLCHNFTKELVQIIENKQCSTIALENFFNRRNFILLELDTDQIISNLYNRNKSKKGALNDYISLYGENKMRENLIENIQIKRRLAKLSQNYGAHKYELDINGSLDETLLRFKKIEKNIVENKLSNKKS
ncbi:MAG: hypothetical protein LAT67_04230 [Balneolales bacterium]|nr:hypothetical protein [Balneolales bacterium]